MWSQLSIFVKDWGEISVTLETTSVIAVDCENTAEREVADDCTYVGGGNISFVEIWQVSVGVELLLLIFNWRIELSVVLISPISAGDVISDDSKLVCGLKVFVKKSPLPPTDDSFIFSLRFNFAW